MRVLNSLTDPRVGGPQMRALGVAKGLRIHGIETIFLLPNGNDAFEEIAIDAEFAVSRPNLPRLMPPRNFQSNAHYLVDFYPAVRRIRQVIEDHEIDIVHASTTMNYRAGVAAQQASVPLAWFFNDTGTPWPVNRITGYAARLFADEIAVAADAVHHHFFDDSVESKSIYAPVDTDAFDPATVNPNLSLLRDELGLDPNLPVVGMVGNVNPIKGHEYFLRAIARLRNRHGPITVPIVGPALDSRTEYFEKLQRLRRRLGLEETVRFVGHRTDIPCLLSLFDVFVLPSIAEACPITVLEAMAMERPIVATRVGGVPEQIHDGEHGWLVPSKDPDALAGAICDALNSPAERQRRGRAARRRAMEQFSIEHCVEEHLELYEATLRSSQWGSV